MKMERVPNTVLNEEILEKLDLQTLSSVACVNRAFRFSVESHALPSVSFIHLSTMSPDDHTLNKILGRCYKGLNSLTLNCLRLQDQPLCGFLTPSIQELNLWCCSLLSYQILADIAHHCPNLSEPSMVFHLWSTYIYMKHFAARSKVFDRLVFRVLTLEFADNRLPNIFTTNLALMFSRCLYLESLSLKIRGTAVDSSSFQSIEFLLPTTVKTLKLQPVLEAGAIRLIRRVGGNSLEPENLSIPTSPYCKLQSLSLVLDVINDGLLITITNSVPLLVELDLEDRPNKEPLPDHDFTNIGLQSISFCQHLTALSLVRGRFRHQGAFKRINDMGMFLLSEGCKGLESVRLCGFSKVSDAGFAALLHSCQSLKKFEIRNALFLSDLAFHDLTDNPCALVEVRLLSCQLITSETVKKLASSKSLEVLDLGGCKSVEDSCLSSISCLHKLTALNLTGADVTDSGLSVLGQGNLPIKKLCLRGCKRVTDQGVSLLLCGGVICQTLTALDLGYMRGISDKTVLTIASSCIGIIDLCLRSCFYVTDSSVEALARKRTFQEGNKQLRRLDLCNCIFLSPDSLRWFKRPSFLGLHWLGIGQTRLASHGAVTAIYKERPWMTVCLDGCEMGCQDGWQFHRSENH